MIKILFFGKKDHWATEKCLEFLKNNKVMMEAYTGCRDDRFPEDVGGFEFDLLISFSSPWVIPVYLLEKANVASLNFHPGPPDYPGIGCTNFAIYNEEKTFGVTCHHMDEKVDAGAIVEVRHFPLFETDSVKTLTDRCYHHLFALFVSVISDCIADKKLASSPETWTRKPYTRKQLNELCRIELDMEQKEIAKRVRAAAFPGHPGAFLELHGIRFQAQDKDDS